MLEKIIHILATCLLVLAHTNLGVQADCTDESPRTCNWNEIPEDLNSCPKVANKGLCEYAWADGNFCSDPGKVKDYCRLSCNNCQGENTCTDTDNWDNGDGSTCKDYMDGGLCIDGKVQPGFEYAMGESFESPELNCCACGKSTNLAGNLAEDCIWDNWRLGTCSKTCGGGLRTDERSVLSHARHGGNDCYGLSTRTEQCNDTPCPVNCEWNEWSIGTCSRECGAGSRVNIRTKKRESRYGGNPCYGPDTQKESCNVQECPGTFRITSDGLTASSPHCSFRSTCKYDSASKQECANALCVAQGYASGIFVSASNNFCSSSFASSKFYIWELDEDKIDNVKRPNEAQITADCVADPTTTTATTTTPATAPAKATTVLPTTPTPTTPTTEPPSTPTQVLTENGATDACKSFGHQWGVAKVSDGALVCTLNGLDWVYSCNECDKWRLLVWIDGSNDFIKGNNSFYANLNLSTKAGIYYSGHKPCEDGDNYQVCGDWTHQGATHSTTQGTNLPGVQSPTNPVTNQANSCTDTVAWSDGWGGTCEYYRNSGACKNGRLLDGFVIENSDVFNSPFENCCVCGKQWYARDNKKFVQEACGVTCDDLAGRCGLNKLEWCPIDIEKHCPVTCRNKICQNIDNGAIDTAGEGCELYDKNPARCGYYDDQNFVSRNMCCACGGGGQDDCVCNTIVDKDGHGNCQKEYEGQIGCYVQEPSGCGDTIMGIGNRTYSLSKACKLKDCKTKGGDQVNQACVFPFRYNGIEYNGCAKVTHTEPWCSTEVDSQGSYISGKWGTCGSDCPVGGPNYKLLNVNMQCQSSEQKLTSRKNDENACAKACKLQNGCQYFKVTPTGDCYWEKTTDGTCPEGWISAYGSTFYETINE